MNIVVTRKHSCAVALSLFLLIADAGLQSQTAVTNSEVLHVDATASGTPPKPTSFHGGTAKNPRGETLGMNARYLTLNGKPWLPMMGEFHYTRVPASQWEQEILKMKSAGVSIIATYVIWIHHEEIEGQFDWTENRNLRRFVELCGKHGMYVYPRIGP